MSNTNLSGDSPDNASNNVLNNAWPPRGWQQLGLIKKLQGQAILKDPIHATITGLTFKIDPVPVSSKNNQRNHVYCISIKGWSYSILNESREFDVMSFHLAERLTKGLSKGNFIANIKTKSRSMIRTNRSVERSYMAALFLMKQIEQGIVPDYDRVLRLYKIHPSQRSLYEQDSAYSTSMHCGLTPYLLEKQKYEEAI